MGNFRELKVWEESKLLAIEIYSLTGQGSFKNDFRFRDQIRAASISISSNIAEGDELSSNKQSNRHFYIAKGSVAEVISQLIIAKEIGYVSSETAKILIDKCEYISIMLLKLIRARSK